MRQFYVPDYEHLSAERWVTDDVICHLCRAQEVESDIQVQTGSKQNAPNNFNMDCKNVHLCLVVCM